MELIISIIAVVVSFATIYYRCVKREKKQATLDAFIFLQEQVFDNLNRYTKKANN